MGREVERKFLVRGDAWRSGKAVLYRQGYLTTDKHRTVHVRIAGTQAYLTVKGITAGRTRREYEFDIPLRDANEMLDTLCLSPVIEKRRTRIEYDGLVWEVDEFLGANRGLVIAEVELTSEDQPVNKPPWVGAEVSDDPRYYNANLVGRAAVPREALEALQLPPSDNPAAAVGRSALAGYSRLGGPSIIDRKFFAGTHISGSRQPESANLLGTNSSMLPQQQLTVGIATVVQKPEGPTRLENCVAA